MNTYPDTNSSFLAQPHLTQYHLTDDQLDDHLIGDLAPAAAAHLAACDLCSQRLAAALSPIDSFQQVSTAWSERHSATLSIPSLAQPRPFWQRSSAWAAACLALALGLVLANSTRQLSLQTAEPAPTLADAASSPTPPQPVALHLSAPAAAPFIQTASVRPAPPAARISADNHMLRTIDAAFDPSSDTPAALGLAPESGSGTRAPASLQD